MTINNELIQITNKNKNYEKGMNYIANNVFIYYNSIKIIHDTDPSKYPKKGADHIILQKQVDYVENLELNSNFQAMLSNFNSEFRKSVQHHKDIWVSVNKNFKTVDAKLYSAVKNCMENLQKISKFNLKTMWEFMSSYKDPPSFVDKKKRPEFLLETYFPNYTGMIEHHEYERRILYKLHFIKLAQKPVVQDINKFLNAHKETKSSIKKKDLALNKEDVYLYYNLKSDHPSLISLLFSNSVYHSYRAAVPSQKKGFVRAFYKQLKVQEKMDWILQEISLHDKELISQKIWEFKRRVKNVLDLRKLKIEREKNFIKNHIHKFLLENSASELNSECNILLMLKLRVSQTTVIKNSRFSREWKTKLERVQTKSGLATRDDRRAAKTDVDWFKQRLSLHTISVMPKIFSNWVEDHQKDSINIMGELSQHYLKTLLMERRIGALRGVLITGEKEIGPEVHIEGSIGEINNLIHIFRFWTGNKQLSSLCSFNVEPSNNRSTMIFCL